ncbi:MAG: ribonuclease HII [Clostridia bacterium]|nr:ribonuclease HII [Clostridia bacterium]
MMKVTDYLGKYRAMTLHESEFWSRNQVVAGMDEAGRGPLAGPVVCACVVLSSDTLIEGVDDSKKLSEKKRERLYELICSNALSVGVGWASREEIDDINILNATLNGFRRAYELARVQCSIDALLVDGNTRVPVELPQRTVVHGDAQCYLIAAASIVAKVARDRYMTEADKLYPQYGFARNKGYGTASHIAALREYGPCPLHRESFIGNFVDCEGAHVSG